MDTMNEKIVSYWKELLIILLIIISIIFWSMYNSSQKEIEEIKGLIKVQKIIEDINKSLVEIKDREEKLYPDIDKKVVELNKTISESKKIREYLEKNKPKKELIANEIKKLTIDQVSKYFSDNGYSNSISPSSK